MVNPLIVSSILTKTPFIPVNCSATWNGWDKNLYDGKADLVTVPGTSGSIGILNNHAPLVSSLKKGEVKVILNEKEEFFKINGGVVEVSQNNVVVLAS